MDTPTMASSRLKVILGTAELGQRKFADEKPVSKQEDILEVD